MWRTRCRRSSANFPVCVFDNETLIENSSFSSKEFGIKKRKLESLRYISSKFSMQSKLKNIIILNAVFFLLGFTLFAQTPSEFPKVPFESFSPEIQAQVRKVYLNAKAHPRDAEAVGLLAMNLQTYDQHETAAKFYVLARSLAPQEFRWMYYHAVAIASAGNHREAIRIFREALNKNPDHLPSQIRIADSLLAVGMIEESKKFYEAAALRGKFSQVFYGLGRISILQNNREKAQEYFQQAITISPEYGIAHYALGILYRDLGKIELAKEHLALSQKFLYVRPRFDDPLMAAVAELNASAATQLKLGVALDDSGDINGAIAAHLRALEVNPNFAQVHINLISLYARANQPGNAEKHYREAVAINPKLAESHYNFGVLLSGQQKFAEAAKMFLLSAELNPFHAESHQNYAMIIEREGKLDEAEKHFRMAIENKPTFRQSHFHLGRILVSKNLLPEAIQEFQKSLDGVEDENTPMFLYALGATFIRAGDKPKGIEYLESALIKAKKLQQSGIISSLERDLNQLKQK